MQADAVAQEFAQHALLLSQERDGLHLIAVDKAGKDEEQEAQRLQDVRHRGADGSALWIGPNPVV